jgi:Flp pilus assembly protein TadG
MRHRDERGYSESVQWAMLTPLLMLLLLGAIQVGLWWHGRNTVLHAAAAAAEAESAYLSAPGSGQRAAEIIAAAGGIQTVTVAVNRGAERVDVVVSGSVPLLVDLGMSEVSQRASSPMERAE